MSFENIDLLLTEYSNVRNINTFPVDHDEFYYALSLN
jgi:hypothetical protein